MVSVRYINTSSKHIRGAFERLSTKHFSTLWSIIPSWRWIFSRNDWYLLSESYKIGKQGRATLLFFLFFVFLTIQTFQTSEELQVASDRSDSVSCLVSCFDSLRSRWVCDIPYVTYDRRTCKESHEP